MQFALADILDALRLKCSRETKSRTAMCALQGSTLTRGADLALALVLPVHSHVAMNNVISDYVPKNVAGKLCLGVRTFAGLLLSYMANILLGTFADVKNIESTPVSMLVHRRITMGSPWRLNCGSDRPTEPQPQRTGHHSNREVVVEVAGAQDLTSGSASGGKENGAIAPT